MSEQVETPAAPTNDKRDTPVSFAAAAAAAAAHSDARKQQQGFATTSTSSSQEQANKPAAATTTANPAAASSDDKADVTQTATTSASSESEAAPAAAPKKVNAPPKVNPWKVRSAEQTPTTLLSPTAEKSASDLAMDKAETMASSTKATHGARSSGAVEDQSLWPSLDKAAQQETAGGHGQQRRQSAPEGGNASQAASSHSSATAVNGTTSEPHAVPSKPAGKKEWVKYTPIITHTPIASQLKRGGNSNGNNNSSQGRTPGSGRSGHHNNNNNGVPRFGRSTSAGTKDNANTHASGEATHGMLPMDPPSLPMHQQRAGRTGVDHASRPRTGDRKRAQSASNQRTPRSPPIGTGDEGQHSLGEGVGTPALNTADSSRSSSQVRGEGQTPDAGAGQPQSGQHPLQNANGHVGGHAPGQPNTGRPSRESHSFSGPSSNGRSRGGGSNGRGHRGGYGGAEYAHIHGQPGWMQGAHGAPYRNGRMSFGSSREFAGYGVVGNGGGPEQIGLSFVNPAQQQRQQQHVPFNPAAVLGMPPMLLDPLMAQQLVQQQLEYYFSIENLCKDLFLRKHMDAEGFVALPILARFNRVRSITMDYGLVRDVCAASSLIELRSVPNALDKIRKQDGWAQWVLPEDQRDASTRPAPQTAGTEEPAHSQTQTNGDLSDSVTAPVFVPGQQLKKQSSASPQVEEVAAMDAKAIDADTASEAA